MGFIPLLDPSARCQQPAQPWNEADGIKTSWDEGKPEANLGGFINFPKPSIYHKVSNWKKKTRKADDYCEMSRGGLEGVVGGGEEILQKLGEN